MVALKKGDGAVVIRQPPRLVSFNIYLFPEIPI